MQKLDFQATISQWVRKTQQRQEAVFKESAKRMIQIMQEPVGSGGNMPIDTGFLRASLRVYNGKTVVQTISNIAKGSGFTYTDGAYNMVINSMKVGDVITAVYLANYALRVEHGYVGTDALGRTYNQRGRHFVKLAAQRWQSVVRQVCAELKARN